MVTIESTGTATIIGQSVGGNPQVSISPILTLTPIPQEIRPISGPSYKILILCTTIYPIPLAGYGGVEKVVEDLLVELHRRGHQVSVVACEGSKLPEGVELIPVPVRCTEEHAYSLYKGRLVEFDSILDHSFGYWSIQSNIGMEPQLPIIKTHHTDPSIWQSGPPIQYPCLVGISKDHARRLRLAYGCAAEYCWDGVDTTFYHYDPSVKRNGRLLHIGRYTPEKGVLETILLAKRLKMPLDCYGDVEIVSSRDYIDRCRRECDGVMVRFFPGISREKTVELYNTYRAMVTLPNWCLLPDTPVISNPGLMEIDKLQSGDLVLNGAGSKVEVKSVLHRSYSGKVLKITPQVLAFPVKMTPEHYVYTLDVADYARPSIANMGRRNLRIADRVELYEKVMSLHTQGMQAKDIREKTGVAETTYYYWVHRGIKPKSKLLPKLAWKRAGDLKVGDYVGFPIHHPEQPSTMATTDLSKVKSRYPRKYLPGFLPITPDLLWLVGLYAADGSASGSSVSFSLGSHETDTIQRVERVVHQIFNMDTYQRTRKNCTEVLISSKTLVDTFKYWCGDGAHDKHFPEWAVSQTEVGPLLKGWWDGDGYSIQPNKYKNYGGSTVSKQLAFQIVQLLLRNGVITALNCKTQGGKAFSAGRIIYQIQVSGSRSDFCKLVGLPPPTGKIGHIWHSAGFFYGDCFWMRIQKIEPENYEGEVWDIHTDGSFVAGPMIVHNSEPYGLVYTEAAACGLPIVTLNTGSLPEVVSHGVSGFTCQDSDEVARVLTSGDLAKIKPEDCVAWAQKFSREKMTDRYLELIERVQQGHRW